MKIEDFKEQFGGLYSGEYDISQKEMKEYDDPCYGIKVVICTYQFDRFEDELKQLLSKYSI